MRSPPPTPRLRLIEAEPSDTPPQPDAETKGWIEAAIAGDMEAWTQLYLAEFDGLARHVSYLVGDIAVTEDLVQESFARALANLSRYSGQASFGAWLRGIARNLVRKHWRSKARRERALDGFGHVTPDVEERDPESSLARERRARQLGVALEELPDNLREAFVLRDVEGLSVPECAALVGISEGNFRVRAARARSRLRERFADAGLIDHEVSP